MKLMEKGLLVIRSLPIWPHLIVMARSPNKSVFYEDARRFAAIHDKRALSGSDGETFRYIWATLPFLEELRSVFYYRFPKAARFRWMAPGAPAVYLNVPKIGPGLFLHHGFATIVDAKEIGRNFWCNQQVTVGFNGPGNAPTIGDNVRVAAGAKVIGNIKIGDNAIIGAGAVVTKNVPANSVVVGNPARIIKRDGKEVNEPL